MPASEQYDAIAEDYAHAREEYYSRYPNPSSDVIASAVQGRIRGKRVLDMGCGTGGDLGFLLGEGADVYGVDPSEKMLEIAKRDHPAARLSCQSAEILAFPSAFFHAVVSKYALNYSPDPALAVREFRRITKPGGLLVLVIAHPAAELFGKESATYGDNTPARMPLWNGAMTTESKGHALSAYLEPILREGLEIVHFGEGPSAQVREDVPWRVPFYFSLILRKPRVPLLRRLRRMLADPAKD
jgi:SAM-dependent methyltransferase